MNQDLFVAQSGVILTHGEIERKVGKTVMEVNRKKACLKTRASIVIDVFTRKRIYLHLIIALRKIEDIIKKYIQMQFLISNVK